MRHFHSSKDQLSLNGYEWGEIEPDPEPNDVVITLHEGGVANIRKPDGIRVEIQDLDIEQYQVDPDDRKNYRKDADGDWFQRMEFKAIAKPIPSKFVKTITVKDPDTGNDIEVEIRKLATGGMMGVDASYLEQEVGPVYSPFDFGSEVHVPDDEK